MSKKKLLLISDDIRFHTGVGNIGKDLIFNTVDRYSWIQLAATPIKNDQLGKRLDLSEDIGNITGVKNASVFLYPIEGFGNADILRKLLRIEKPDAIFLITDPRQFVWLFEIGMEIRKQVPIIYLNIWDNYPAPYYNREFYETCDTLLAISKQTKLINELVLGEELVKEKILTYVPHGRNPEDYFPIAEKSEEFEKFKQTILGDQELDFVALFNSRNIRRKKIPDLLAGFKVFLDTLSEEKAEKCKLILHTQKTDANGTDLLAVIEMLFGKNQQNVVFTPSVSLDVNQVNYLYNMSDITCQISDAEGWGMSLTESLLAGTMIMGNVTGGIQDQMGFDYTPIVAIPSNHRKYSTKSGSWAIPIFPSNSSIVGSVPTPYIYEDRVSIEDVAKAFEQVYHMTPVERKQAGEEGREYALKQGYTDKEMANKVADAVNETLAKWKPVKPYEFLEVTEAKERRLNHPLIF